MNDSELVKKYVKFVYWLTEQKVTNKSDIDDICQEVFLKYVDKKPTFENDKAAKGWFTKVTINVIRNYYTTAEMRYRADVEEDEYESMPSDKDFAKEVEGNLLHKEQLDKIRPECRTVLTLRYDYGFSIREIAKYAGEKPDRVKTLLTRGKREYKHLMDEIGKGDNSNE